MAGGFAAGFGTAFADSFNTAYENRKAQEHDTFQTYYKSYLDKQSKDEEWKREDKKYVDGAKALVASSGAPLEAWGWVYQQMKAGVTGDKITDMLANGTFEVKKAAPSDGSGTASKDNNLTGQAQSSVDAQMTQSGMTPPAQGGIFGQFNTGMQNKFNQKIAKQQGVDPDVIAKSMSTDSVQSEPIPGMDGSTIKYIPGPSVSLSKINSLAEAISYKRLMLEQGRTEDAAKADRLIQDFNAQDQIEKEGNVNFFQPTVGAIMGDKPGTWNGVADRVGDKWVNRKTGEEVSNVRAYDKPVLDAFDTLADKTAEPREKLVAARQNIVSMTRTVSSMQQIAEKVPEALDMSGDIISTADKYVKGIGNIYKTVTGASKTFINDDGTVNERTAKKSYDALSTVEERLQGEIDAMEKTGVMDRAKYVAIAASMIQVKQQKLAYQYGMAMGQEGRSLDQKEQKAFQDAAAGKGRIDVLVASASDYIKEAYDNTLAAGDAITREGELRMAPYGGLPMPTPLVENLDDYLKSQDVDEKTGKSLYDDVMKYRNYDPVAALDGVEQESKDAEKVSTGIPKEYRKAAEKAGVDDATWDLLDEQSKKDIQELYGE